MQIIIKSMKTGCNVSRVTTKPTIWHVRPAKTPISLGIRPVWSEYSLSPWRNIKSLATHWAHSEDSDQTGRMGIRPVWSESSLGAHWSFCWFCHVPAHVSKGLKDVLSPLLGKRDLVCVLLVHLFVCLCHFLFLLVSGASCGLRLWHSLDFSINCFER